MNKVAMIGLDAGDLLYVQSNVAQLPNLHGMFTRGELHTLDTTAALLTGSVWPSFYTGSNPDTHGIYHNLQWDQRAMRLRRVTDDWLPCRPFWLDLDSAGFRCVVLDVPMSFAPRLEHGIEVVNWGAHDQLGPYACSQADLGRAILRRFGRHPMGNEVPVDKGHRQRARIQSDLIKGVRAKGALAQWLMTEQQWDLFLLVFGETHRAGHILWPDPELGVDDEALLSVYQAVDESVGTLLRSVPDDALVVLFALHGMEANRSQEHFVSPVLECLNARWMARNEGGAPATGQRSLMRWLRDHIPAHAQHLIADAVPAAFRDWVVDRSLAGGRDWTRTPSFPLHADLNGYIRLNMQNREHDGMLAPGHPDTRAYIDAISRTFNTMRSPASGESLVEDVVRGEEVFSGARAAHLPDLIIRWRAAGNVREAELSELGSFSGRRGTGRGGNHRPEGFCVIDGREGVLPSGTEPRHITELAGFITDTLRYPGSQSRSVGKS